MDDVARSGDSSNLHARHRASLGNYDAEFRSALERLERDQAVARLWKKDATLWKNGAENQAFFENSLGWLNVAETMLARLPEIDALTEQVRSAGFEFAVVLGMGGSSLCPELLRRTFGSKEGYPELFVLDSTVPTAIRHLEQKIDVGKTLFIVASKSSLTTEPQMFQRYFRDRVKRVKGDASGESFIAITDPGSQTAKDAVHGHFRKIFLDMPDIVGRYSALSYFGIVPFALMGGDAKALLDSAVQAAQACSDTVGVSENPGARLGATLAALAAAGRNKLTFVTPQPLAALGLWIEHLLAESTGKDGKGLVPVVGEPLGPPEIYGDDRAFVYIHTEANDDAEQKLAALEAAGHPVLRHTLRSPLDLGGEFFVWEFATVLAASLLEINPFDQPNAEESKENTKRLLAEHAQNGVLPQPKLVMAETTLRIFGDAENCDVLRRGSSSMQAMLAAHLARLAPGDYFAIAQFVEELKNYELLLQEIRLVVRDEKKVATTTGYGPRFLHATGQLHKGGPDSCVLLQLTSEDINDIDVPGEKFSFGVLKQAQALGDFEAWSSHHRRAIRVDLGRDVEKGLRRLLALVKEAIALPVALAAAAEK